MGSSLKLVIILALVAGFSFLSFVEPAHTQSAAKLKSSEEIVREHMIDISRQLNVTCNECHKVENFKDGSKNTFKVAKAHMDIVELLKSNGFDGKNGPQATCYMCHRGELRPAYKETMKIITKKVEKKPEAKENTEAKKE